MSKLPPNFRNLERNNCLICKHMRFSFDLYTCRKFDYIIKRGIELPTRCVCDDFEWSYVDE